MKNPSSGPLPPLSPDEILAQADAVEAAVQEAVRQALRIHKLLGNPVASWENGQVVWIPPHEIPDWDPAPTREAP